MKGVDGDFGEGGKWLMFWGSGELWVGEAPRNLEGI